MIHYHNKYAKNGRKSYAIYLKKVEYVTHYTPTPPEGSQRARVETHPYAALRSKAESPTADDIVETLKLGVSTISTRACPNSFFRI